MPLNIPPLQWPKIYNMVNLGGIDLATANGSVVPGIYQKITAALTSDNIEVFYNWKFADIVLPPSKVIIDVSVANQYIINEEILIKSDDTVGIIGFIRIPVIVPLTAEENRVYDIPIGADGFGPVTVDVPIPTPSLVSLNVTENGVYEPSTGEDGFSEVTVNVPDIPPVLTELIAEANGVYTPATGIDGFSEVTVNVPDIPPVLTGLSVSSNGTYNPAQGVDGFNQVIVSVPNGLVSPLHFDAHNGYVSDNTFVYGPSDARAYDVFQVVAGRKYLFMLGQTVGNRFRVAIFQTDPYYVTSNISGSSIYSSNSPTSYAATGIYTPAYNGYVAVMKSTAAQNNIHSYCIDLLQLVS